MLGFLIALALFITFGFAAIFGPMLMTYELLTRRRLWSRYATLGFGLGVGGWFYVYAFHALLLEGP